MKNVKVVSFLSQKGGPGKTTLTQMAATYLSSKGVGVCVIDADFPQHSFAQQRADDIAKVNKLANKVSEGEKALEGEVGIKALKLKQLALEAKQQALKKALAGANEYEVLTCEISDVPFIIKKIKSDKKSSVELIFIDVPGTLNVAGMADVVNSVDVVFIPCELELKSILSAQDTVEFVSSINEKLPMYLLWTKLKSPFKKEAKKKFEGFFKENGISIMDYYMPDTVKISYDISTLFPMDIFAPRFGKELMDILYPGQKRIVLADTALSSEERALSDEEMGQEAPDVE